MAANTDLGGEGETYFLNTGPILGTIETFSSFPINSSEFDNFPVWFHRRIPKKIPFVRTWTWVGSSGHSESPPSTAVTPPEGRVSRVIFARNSARVNTLLNHVRFCLLTRASVWHLYNRRWDSMGPIGIPTRSIYVGGSFLKTRGTVFGPALSVNPFPETTLFSSYCFEPRARGRVRPGERD